MFHHVSGSQVLLLLVSVVLQYNANFAAMISTADSTKDHMLNISGLGMVRGTIGLTARTNQKVFKFYNVPYAQPPVGPLRFKAPRAVDPWNDVRDVTAPGLECPQPVKGLNQKDENCLTLSVFTKNTTGDFPVMVYLHGGSFYLGLAANHPPDYLLERDVLLVVVQYRLGPLGFMSTMSDNIPGNAGMLDIILALRWVQDHIANFGGNPGQVTLFGQSAGAGIISGLLYSSIVPSYLFQQVILQSGGGSSNWAIDSNPIQSARTLATFAGCDINTGMEKIEECLMGASTEALVNALPAYWASGRGTNGIGQCGMVIGGPSGFLSARPFELQKAGDVRKDVRMMGGITKQDGSFILTDIYDKLLQQNMLNNTKFLQYDLLDSLNKLLGIQDDSGALTAFESAALFGKDQLKSGDFNQLSSGLIDIAGAIAMKGPLLRDIHTNVKYSEKQTYLYSFDYQGEHTRFGYGANTSHYPFEGGVHHSNDNIYLFPYPDFATKLNAADTRMSQTMVDLWTSFAITGIPEAAGVPKWLPVDSPVGPYMHIGNPSRIGHNFYEEFTITSKGSTLGSIYGMAFSIVSICLSLLRFSYC